MHIIEKKEDRSNLGMFLSEIAAPNLIRLMQAAGLDYVIVDCEHGSFDFAQVAAIAAVANGIGFPIIVRVPNISREYIQKYLDMGVDGILVPMLETIEQARDLVRFGKYRPEGARGISTMRSHSNYNPENLITYMQKANRSVMLFAQIETKLGVENVTEIAKVDGINGLFIGPNDLSCDLDCIENFHAPQMQKAIKKVIKACNNVGKVSGIITSDIEFLRHCEKMGMCVLSCNSELGLLKNAMQSMKKNVLR